MLITARTRRIVSVETKAYVCGEGKRESDSTGAVGVTDLTAFLTRQRSKSRSSLQSRTADSTRPSSTYRHHEPHQRYISFVLCLVKEKDILRFLHPAYQLDPHTTSREQPRRPSNPEKEAEWERGTGYLGCLEVRACSSCRFEHCVPRSQTCRGQQRPQV